MKKFNFFIFIISFALLVLSGCNKKSEPSDDDKAEVITVKDICDNEYKCVKIGDQVWMAENMRCDKYDTQSNRKGAKIKAFNGSSYGDPYYAICMYTTSKYSGNLSSEQRLKLGYLYNWAAAVGLENGEVAESQTTPFEGNRQGICPNGWHVPTVTEWETLIKTIGGNISSNECDKSGVKLKTTSGWYNNENGTDLFSFAALPAGALYIGENEYIGHSAEFLTATPLDISTISIISLTYEVCINYSGKYDGSSVRCVKN